MRTVAFLFLILFCLTINGQKTNFGIHFAPTLTSLKVRPLNNVYDPKLSVSLGLNTERLISHHFSLKSELNYERKGAKENILWTDEFGNSIGDRIMKINSDYLAISFLISSFTDQKTKLYLTTGPFLGFLLSNKATYNAIGNYTKQTIDFSKNFKKIDFGLTFACGIDIPVIDNLLIDLGIKANIGLLNICNINSYKTKAYGIQLGIKYIL